MAEGITTVAKLPLRFESYGVGIEITSNQPDMLSEAKKVASVSLLGNLGALNGKVDHYFELNRKPRGGYELIQNGEYVAGGRSRKKFFNFFDSMIRVAVGEYAVDRVFMHAGVVGWHGKAIVMPGDSYKGKSTLVAEFVRCGAEYYSDEFAVFDANGRVHPFARPLSMRTYNGTRSYHVTAEDLGGISGTEPLEVGTVLLTEYIPRKRWEPKILTAGQGIMEMLPHTLSIRHRPDFSLHVLNNVVHGAIITSSPRGTAEKFAKILLNFVDKCEI